MSSRRHKKYSRRRRKRRSGNGTAAAQDLYCLINLPFFWVWKIGISKDAKNRAQDLSLETRGYWLPIAWVRIFFAYQIEQRLLSITSWAHAPFDGLTETRYIIVGPFLWLSVMILAIIKYALPFILLLTIIYYFQ